MKKEKTGGFSRIRLDAIKKFASFHPAVNGAPHDGLNPAARFCRAAPRARSVPDTVFSRRYGH